MEKTDKRKISLERKITSALYGVGAGLATGVIKNLLAGPNVGGAVGGAVALTIFDNYRRRAHIPEYIVDTGIATTTSVATYMLTDFLFNYVVK